MYKKNKSTLYYQCIYIFMYVYTGRIADCGLYIVCINVFMYRKKRKNEKDKQRELDEQKLVDEEEDMANEDDAAKVLNHPFNIC